MENNKISRWLFLVFIFLLPFQTRFILFPTKPEFLGFSVYLSEVFLWCALAFWLINDYKKVKIHFYILLFLFFCFLSIIWTPDKIAAFRLWLYFFEGILAFSYLKLNREIWTYVSKTFLTSLFLVSCFAIWQFFNLGSPAFKWLGLSARGAWNLGDIVIGSDGMRWLRAYGTFPHPNILGGYLALGILLLIAFVKSGATKIFAYPLGAIFIFSLFLTFSRSAWLGLSVVFIYYVFKNFDNKEIRKFFIFSVFFIFSISFIFWPFVTSRVKSIGYLENKSNTERLASWKEGIKVWSMNPVLGAGIGNYTNYKNSQPAHNIFLMVLAELGAIGFLLYIFIWRKLWKSGLRSALILFFIIGLFDHYFWTLYPGQMLFWVGLAFFQEN